MPTAASTSARQAKTVSSVAPKRARDGLAYPTLHRPHVGDRLLRINRLDGSPHGSGKRRRIALGADDERHLVVSELRLSPVDHRVCLAVELVVAHVADDADDLAHRRL